MISFLCFLSCYFLKLIKYNIFRKSCSGYFPDHKTFTKIIHAKVFGTLFAKLNSQKILFAWGTRKRLFWDSANCNYFHQWICLEELSTEKVTILNWWSPIMIFINLTGFSRIWTEYSVQMRKIRTRKTRNTNIIIPYGTVENIVKSWFNTKTATAN